MAAEELRLRPHHLFCGRFLALDSPERSEVFKSFEQDLRRILDSDDKVVIEIAEGVDELCGFCLHCRNSRCASPQGNEEKVRRWDEIILEELGMSYGYKETNRRLRAVIDEKVPLDLCKECSHKQDCYVYKLNLG